MSYLINSTHDYVVFNIFTKHGSTTYGIFSISLEGSFKIQSTAVIHDKKVSSSRLVTAYS